MQPPFFSVKEGLKQFDSMQGQLVRQGSCLPDIAHAPKLWELRDLLVDCGIGANTYGANDLAKTYYISQHRPLIFCQMKDMLEIVQSDVLWNILSSVQFLRLDGSVEANKRQTLSISSIQIPVTMCSSYN